MSIAEAGEISRMVDRIKGWSVAERFHLVRKILDTLAVEASATEPVILGSSAEETRKISVTTHPLRRVPFESIIGFLKTDREPPDDEECRRIVEEERGKKHGS